MKHYLLFLISSLMNAYVISQSVPKGISYQAVAINTENQAIPGFNNENTYWSNKDIQVKFTIYDQYPGGIAQMVETHQATTDRFGVFNVVIGQGQNISGDLFDVEWSQGTAHLQVEIDFHNDGKFKLIGIEKFWSVPYAIQSGNSSGANSNDNSKKLDSLINDLQEQLNKIKSLNDRDSIIGNEFQDLTIIGDSLLISNGEGVKLIDNDAINELQTLRISNDSLILSGNNSGIKLPQNNVFVGDSSDQNELQDLNLIGDSLLISGGTGVKLNQKEIPNQLQSIIISNDSLYISGLDTLNGPIEFAKKVSLNYDKSDTNEIQYLSLQGDSLKISRGNSILLDNNKSINPQIFVFPTKPLYTKQSNTTYTGGNPVNWISKDTFKLIELKKGQKLNISTGFNLTYQDHYIFFDSSTSKILQGIKSTYLYSSNRGIYEYRHDFGDLRGSNTSDFKYVADHDVTIFVEISTPFRASSNPPVIPTEPIRDFFIEVF